MSGPLWTARPVHAKTLGRHVRPGVLGVLRLTLVFLGAMWGPFAPTAHADDRVATPWQIQAGTAPLLQAPPPAEPVTICVIDTGVNLTPDLEITARESLLGGTLDDIRAGPGTLGHGTPVAHFAAAKVNGWGGAGTFPHARVSAVRVFPKDGGAHWQDYTRALDRCYLVDAHTKVVVMSLGGQTIDPREATALENRIVRARTTLGHNVVVAAGNGGGPADFPGEFPASFTVAALDANSALCGFSARGANVDIAAPGCGVEQAGWDGSLWRTSGTSFAAPIVAGALAAIRSYRPDLSPDQAEQVLLSTARPGSLPVLDASAALRAIGRGDIVDSYRPYSPPAVAPPPSAPIPTFRVAESSSGPLATTRLKVPRLRVGSVIGGRVLVRAVNRPRGAMLELRAGGRKMVSPSAKVRVKIGRARLIKARYVTELSSSRWIHVTIRNP